MAGSNKSWLLQLQLRMWAQVGYHGYHKLKILQWLQLAKMLRVQAQQRYKDYFSFLRSNFMCFCICAYKQI